MYQDRNYRAGKTDLPASESLHLPLLWSGTLCPEMAVSSVLTSSKSLVQPQQDVPSVALFLT